MPRTLVLAASVCLISGCGQDTVTKVDARPERSAVPVNHFRLSIEDRGSSASQNHNAVLIELPAGIERQLTVQVQPDTIEVDKVYTVPSVEVPVTSTATVLVSIDRTEPADSDRSTIKLLLHAEAKQAEGSRGSTVGPIELPIPEGRGVADSFTLDVQAGDRPLGEPVRIGTLRFKGEHAVVLELK